MMSEQEKAKALGLKRYRDGTACRNGHYGERWTRDRACCVCATLRHQAYVPTAPRLDRGPAKRRGTKAAKIEMPEIKRISSFISPPTRAQLMGGK